MYPVVAAVGPSPLRKLSFMVSNEKVGSNVALRCVDLLPKRNSSRAQRFVQATLASRDLQSPPFLRLKSFPIIAKAGISIFSDTSCTSRTRSRDLWLSCTGVRRLVLLLWNLITCTSTRPRDLYRPQQDKKKLRTQRRLLTQVRSRDTQQLCHLHKRLDRLKTCFANNHQQKPSPRASPLKFQSPRPLQARLLLLH